MADGSVRFITDGIDEKVFRALVTYKGGEKIENLDAVAPLEKINESTLKKEPKSDVNKDEPKKDEPKKDEAKDDAKKDEPKKADGKGKAEELDVKPKVADPKKDEPKK
jgi:penicillin-insensitive murein endopeptidase